MKLSEAPRCVPFEDFKVRNTRVKTCLSGMFHFSSDDFVHLWFDLACEYAEFLASYPDSGVTAKQLIRNNLYWHYWLERWVERSNHFIWWQNPEKTLDDFKDFHRYGMPPLKVFDLLRVTSI